jgi:hypothetical protein
MQAGKTGRATRTEVLPAKGVMFFDAGDSDYHKAPARQLVIVNRGEVEVMVGDGTSRPFKASEASSQKTSRDAQASPGRRTSVSSSSPLNDREKRSSA